MVGLLGPNGAGKTTTFNLVTGMLQPDRGDVMLDGVSISELSMPERSRQGIGYLPQEPSVFAISAFATTCCWRCKTDLPDQLAA